MGSKNIGAMEAPSMALLLPQPNPTHSPYPSDFDTLFSHLNGVLLSSNSTFSKPLKTPQKAPKFKPNVSRFLSTSISMELNHQNQAKPISQNCSIPTSRALVKSLSVFDRALIGAGAGGFAGAFTYFCLHPLDTIKTKLQTRGASQIYSSTLDAIVKTFQSKGVLGFYSGISAVIVGSTFSSAVYFGTCEFGKSLLSKFEKYPSVLIPPTAGAMGNIVSSAIMVPKELITQRMQAGAKGRSWEVLIQILDKDGVLGLYAGYSATLLRNLPAGVLSYSSFEYLKSAVLRTKKGGNLEPIESICCGALAGAISASLTTPLDVIKTRLMTQVHGDAVNKVAAATYSGVREMVEQILKEEGWIGFTRGMGPRVVHSACFSAMGYFAFETARLAILNQYLKHKQYKETSLAPQDQEVPIMIY